MKISMHNYKHITTITECIPKLDENIVVRLLSNVCSILTQFWKKLAWQIYWEFK